MNKIGMDFHIRRVCSSASWVLFMIVAVFAGYLNAKGQAGLMNYMLILAVLISFGANYRNGKIVCNKRIPPNMYFWIAFLPFQFVAYKANSLGNLRIICGILLPLILMTNMEWLKRGKEILKLFTGINVFFTLFFFALPQLYQIVIDAYGTIPAGTELGKAGYRAGISDHYSQNGIYITIFLMLVATEFIEYIATEKRRDQRFYRLLITCCVAFFALLLTGKRGVLVFSVVSIAFTFLIASGKKVTNTIKLIIASLIALILIQIMSEFIPEIGLVFERFQIVGEDGSSAERLAMWTLAIKEFFNNPILGNGLWSFRVFYNMKLAHIFHYNDARYQFLNAHNVYLQVLCETGLVGAMIYTIAVAMAILKTVKIVRNAAGCSKIVRTMALFSLCTQTFYVIYSFTGNCLYDVVFLFYSFALSSSLCIEKEMRSKKML